VHELTRTCPWRAFSVELVKPSATRPNPEHALLIFKDRPDDILTQAIGLIGVGLVVSEFTLLSIESIDASAKRADPERSRIVLRNGPDLITA
jgi:hypothetical protein